MHCDPYNTMTTQRGDSSSGASPPAKRQLIADSLYREQHLHEPNARRDQHGAASRSPRASGPGSRPQLLICYLCGQQFGTKSLHIHQPQCYVKKLLQWERSDRATRGPKPLSIDEHEAMTQTATATTTGINSLVPAVPQTIDQFNAVQFDAFTTHSLVPCDVCGRTFLPDRLEVHKRSCRPGHAARKVGGALRTGDAKRSTERATIEDELSTTNPPVTRTDPVEATCRVVKENEPALNSKPYAPSAADGQPLTHRAALRSPQKTTATAAAAAVALLRCRHCHRTFAPARVALHEGVCIERNASDRPRSSAGTAKPHAAAAAAAQRNRSPCRPQQQHTAAAVAVPIAKGFSNRPATNNGVPRTTPSHPAAVGVKPVAADSVTRVTPQASSSSSRPHSFDSIHQSLDEITRELAMQRASKTPRGAGRPLASELRPFESISPPRGTSPLGSSTNSRVLLPSALVLSTPVSPVPSASTPNVAPLRPMVLPPSPSAASRSQSPSVTALVVDTLPTRPKFCSECGTPVTAATAKFCVECGHRLLT